MHARPRAREGAGASAAAWFSQQLPRLRPEVRRRRVQFVQRAGETVFVPEGWWHGVLNLDAALAVTQNFAHPLSFGAVAAALGEANPKAARRWRRNLERSWPAGDLPEGAVEAA